MTQFYREYANMDKAGFIKCRTWLEVLLRGSTEWCLQRFFRGASNHNDRSQWCE